MNKLGESIDFPCGFLYTYLISSKLPVSKCERGPVPSIGRRKDGKYSPYKSGFDL